MKQKILFLFSLFLTVLNTKAQTNIVPNPSFEIQTPIVDNSGQIERAIPWENPAVGVIATPDLFHSTSTSTLVDVPSNVHGFQSVRTTGNAYAGLWGSVRIWV